MRAETYHRESEGPRAPRRGNRKPRGARRASYPRDGVVADGRLGFWAPPGHLVTSTLELTRRAQDFYAMGGFHYSGSYPMVFQQSAPRSDRSQRTLSP